MLTCYLEIAALYSLETLHAPLKQSIGCIINWAFTSAITQLVRREHWPQTWWERLVLDGMLPWIQSGIISCIRVFWMVYSYCCGLMLTTTLQWHHNGHDGILKHQPHHCLLNRLFGCRSRKTSKFCVTGLWVGNSPGTGEFPVQMASNVENVSIWWCHHDMATCSGDVQWWYVIRCSDIIICKIQLLETLLAALKKSSWCIINIALTSAITWLFVRRGHRSQTLLGRDYF